jgi:hypothetical protein
MAMEVCLTPDLYQNLLLILSEPGFDGICLISQILSEPEFFELRNLSNAKTNSVIYIIRLIRVLINNQRNQRNQKNQR